MKQRTSRKKPADPLSALSLPKFNKSLKSYPRPLIMWPIEREAIAKLLDLRKEWQKANPSTFNILRKRFERRGGAQRKYPLPLKAALALCLPKHIRGRPIGHSPLATEQSWAIAVLIKYCGVRPVEILSYLGKDTSSDNRAPFRWLARRRAQGEKSLNALSRQGLKRFELKLASLSSCKLKEALLKTVREHPV